MDPTSFSGAIATSWASREAIKLSVGTTAQFFISLCGLPIDGKRLEVNHLVVPRIYCWFVVRYFALAHDG